MDPLFTIEEIEAAIPRVIEAWTEAMRDGRHSAVELYDAILSFYETELRLMRDGVVST